MAQHSKPFGASAIASDHKVFFWARIKLTSIYVLILTFILFGFSTILYQNLDRSLVDASEDNFADVESHHHFVQDTLSTVGNEIILIDIFILVAAAGVSYVLAGYTLRPIQQSVEAQKKFSENASHELRTPLAVMRNDTEVLLRNPHPTPEHTRSILQSNVEEMTRMSSIVEELLTLARSTNVLKTAYEKAKAQGTPGTEEIIKAFEYESFDSPSGKVMMKLGKGHQAVAGTAYGTTRTVNGQITVGNIKYYPVERVQPPEGVKSVDWIKDGMKPGKW